MTITLREMAQSPDQVRSSLELTSYPEGGHYRELWRDPGQSSHRGSATSIIFMLARDEHSKWHRIGATEIWLWQSGSTLELCTYSLERGRHTTRLGPDVGVGEVLQAIVPPHAWQTAKSVGDWSLVSCVVAPAFEFAGFEVASLDWKPPKEDGAGQV